MRCFTLLMRLLDCTSRPGVGNLFRARARWDFPEQLVGRSDKRNHKNEYVYYITIQYFYCKAGKSVRRLVLLAMKKYFNDNRRMPLRWRSESRERRRDFVHFILEKSCSESQRGWFVPERGDDNNASVQLHVNRCTSTLDWRPDARCQLSSS